MTTRADVEKGIGLIEEFIGKEYPCATDEDEYCIRRDTSILFGKLMSMYGDHRGVACVMADMAYNRMRDMDGASSDVARDFLQEMVELMGITPEEVDGTAIQEGSLVVYGKKDAFVY